MKKTGQKLKEAREARGISLQEVSIHLKISNRILKALEEGDSAQLPAKTFLRGFVQSYSQLLRLDSSEILELFQAEMGTTHPKMVIKPVEPVTNLDDYRKNGSTSSSTTAGATSPNYAGSIDSNPSLMAQAPLTGERKQESSDPLVQAPAPPSISIDHATWSRSKQIGTVLIVLVIAGIIFGVVQTIKKYEKEAEIVQTPPIELPTPPRTDSALTTELPIPTTNTEAPISEDSSVNTQSGVAESNQSDNAAAKTTTTVDSNSTTDKSNKTEPAPSPNSLSSVTNNANPPTNAGGTNSADIKTNENAVQPEEIKKPLEVNRTQEVIVEALDRVIVEYSIDDKPKSVVVLNPEKVHTFKGDKKLILNFSDGGSVNVIYNGKDKGVPGNLGKPVQMKFPE